MKKRILSVLLCVSMLSTMVVGCGNKDASTDEKGGKEITFMAPDWAYPGDELMAEFTEKTGIKVIFNEISWGSIRDKVSTASSGGEAAADVFEVDWSWVGEMNSAGWLEPIEMSAEDKADMPTLETFSVDGKILAVPYANDYRIAYYNKDHFEKAGITEAPETWDEVYSALKTIKEKGIVEYPYTMSLNAEESATTSMLWMAFARNGKVFNDDDTLNKDAVLDALKYEKQFVDDGLIDPAMIASNGMDCYRKITSGEASFMVGPTKFVGISSDPEQCTEVGNIVPILLPGIEGTSKQTMALPEALGIASFSKNKEAAKEFVKWFSSADVQKRMYKVNSSIPTRNKVLAEMVEDGTFSNAGAMLDEAKLIKSVFPNGVPAYYAEMSNTFYNNINKMGVGEITPEQAFDAMNKKVNELIEKK